MAHDHSCGSGCGCDHHADTGPRPDVAQTPPPWRPAQRIRVLSIAIFRRGDHILAGPVYDDNGQIKGWRPLGGGIEFGERAIDALARELQEETGQEITDIHHIGVMENLFTHHGETGHEIVMIYAARFANPDIYKADLVAFAEEDGIEMHAKWISLPKALAGRTQLFPAGLAERLLAK
ncbi:NUDIX domain-containing protein [uncultured Pelagimonas sp.]|uniref:NUDIX hydrolase n=1 Tax=uncultured Pelagimonas sp. TaxID=1618102 RepID=UPI0026253F5F|nr:NUDIX domain-containing protein [uncultured Pelagimonas sp.]